MKPESVDGDLDVRGDEPRLMGVATVAMDPFQMVYRGHYITNPNNALLRGNHGKSLKLTVHSVGVASHLLSRWYI